MSTCSRFSVEHFSSKKLTFCVSPYLFRSSLRWSRPPRLCIHLTWLPLETARVTSTFTTSRPRTPIARQSYGRKEFFLTDRSSITRKETGMVIDVRVCSSSETFWRRAMLGTSITIPIFSRSTWRVHYWFLSYKKRFFFFFQNCELESMARLLCCRDVISPSLGRHMQQPLKSWKFHWNPGNFTEILEISLKSWKFPWASVCRQFGISDHKSNLEFVHFVSKFFSFF